MKWILLFCWAQWALAADMETLELVGTPVACRGHGSLKCDCHRGFEGVHCDAVIDWCARRQEDFQGEHNNSALCGPHGVCHSDHENGAACICLAGFTGPFCQNPPTDAKVARRCVQPEIDIKEGSGVVHCNDDERCLLDDLDCAHSRNKEVVEQCRSQKGYCLPDAKVAAVLEQKRREQETRARWSAAEEEQQFKASEPLGTGAMWCVHGDRVCTCDPGYEGDNCEQKVDYCAARLPEIGDEDLGAVCGKHGRCESSPHGIVCVCELGFVGRFCERADPSIVIHSHRCVLQTIPIRVNHTYHCPKGERCVLDDIDCLFGAASETEEQCVEALGWCLPSPVKHRQITTASTINPDLPIVSDQPGSNVSSSPINLINPTTILPSAKNNSTIKGSGMIDEKICDQRVAEALEEARENFS